MTLEVLPMYRALPRDDHIPLSGDETACMQKEIVGLHPLRPMWEWVLIQNTRLPLDWRYRVTR